MVLSSSDPVCTQITSLGISYLGMFIGKLIATEGKIIMVSVPVD